MKDVLSKELSTFKADADRNNSVLQAIVARLSDKLEQMQKKNKQMKRVKKGKITRPRRKQRMPRRSGDTLRNDEGDESDDRAVHSPPPTKQKRWGRTKEIYGHVRKLTPRQKQTKYEQDYRRKAGLSGSETSHDQRRSPMQQSGGYSSVSGGHARESKHS